VRRGTPSPRPERIGALKDGDCIDAPALARHVAVAAHPPPQYKGVACREIHRSGDKSARASGPRLAASERIAAATADRSIVPAADKRATGSNDVLKSQPVIKADLRHPAVEPILQVEVVAEGYPRA
jgi:hypothetical protein